MGQVIEVRLINPANAEVLADDFTLTSTGAFSKTNHEPAHREAIELALKAWSGDIGILKEMQREGEAESAGSGANTCWRYQYSCVLAGDTLDDGVDRDVLAVLFAQYREIKEGE